MVKRIYLEFRSPVRLQQGMNVLPVAVTIYDEKGRLENQNSYLSVIPDFLHHSFHNWQKYVSPTAQALTMRRIRFQPKQQECQLEDTYSNINFKHIADEFKANLNHWLETGWFDENGNRDLIVIKTLESYYREREEVQIFIQTDNKELKGLPWQEWQVLQEFFIIHSHTELSISSTNFKRPQRKELLLADARIRILAIFGDESLELGEEKYLITSLEKYGGIIHVLNQPDRVTLELELADPKGWHILFFAGHSGSDEHGNLGWIENKPGEKIAIDEISKSLERLISDKLQLAIFNSCDGLGLANQLVSQSLPYCIIMREPVESVFARELLRHLLIAFVRGKSLFASMRSAREYLRQEFDEKGKHPGKSWLPVIVANPEARSLTWDGMFTERRLDRKWELIIFALFLVAVFGLPTSILLEFGSFDTLILYARLYPQIVIYPSLMLGLSLYALYRAICLIRQKAKIFWSFTTAVFMFSCISVSLDLNSDPLMLFELKPQAITIVNADRLAEIIQDRKIINYDKKGDLVIDKQQIEGSIKQSIQFENKPTLNRSIQIDRDLRNIALSHNIWNNGNRDLFSVSRWFYAFSYFAIFFCSAEMFALIFQSVLAPTAVFKQNKYITYLIICETGILAWLAFYSCYIQKTKPFLLGSQFNPHFTNLTPLIHVFMFSLSFLTLWMIKLQINTHKSRQIFSLTLIGVLMLTVMVSIGGVSLVDQMFGIGSNSTATTWGGAIAMIYFLWFIIVASIDSRSIQS
jgi:hypothetical protein